MPNFSLPDRVFAEAARQYPTPFYLYDEAGIRKTARALRKAFAWNKGFKEYYAVKALPNPRILSIMLEENCGLDCSSECELLMAKRVGAKGEDIMFSANAMPPHEFAMARSMGATINLDDISDIETLKNNGGIPPTVCLRFNPGGVFGGDNDIMGFPGESKYGFTPEQVLQGLKTLKELGVTGFGIHGFLASNTRDAAYYPRLAGVLLKTALEASNKVGIPLKFINLSGGIGIPYLPDEQPADIDLIGEGVRKAYRKALGERDDVAIYTELGRYMTGPHGWLVTRAMHLKDIHKQFLGVDACASNLMRPAMYGAYHHISVLGKGDAVPDTLYDVTGALCENNDKFAIDRLLPKVVMGDILLIHDGGAHAFAMGYQYNGRLRSAEVLYKENGEYQLIRRAETPEDYFATLL